MRPWPGSKSQAAIVICLAGFVLASSFYSLNTYLSPGSCVAEPPPVSLTLPGANCSCEVSYVTLPGTEPGAASWRRQSSKTPAITCECSQPRVGAQSQGEDGGGDAASRELAACPECEACGRPEAQAAEDVTKRCPTVPWHADRTWHYPAGFPMCSMDACFNYSRCENMEELKVFTYDVPSPPLRSFHRLNESKYWTNDPERACLFFVFVDTSYPWPTRPTELPHWNGGLNHVLVTYGDRWERKGPAAHSIGNASIMATIAYETTHRPGFDISIPLPGHANCSGLQAVSILRRKYLATFRGTRYLGEQGEGVFRSQDSFRGMHNGEDVIVATSCKHSTNDLVREERPHLAAACDDDERLFLSHDFHDLMNATFGIVPAGRQPNSYRFIEVLSAGSIPVLIADNYVKPFDSMIHWHDCLLQFPTSQMHRIVPALRALHEDDILQRQAHCLDFYNRFLKDDNTLQEAAMRALKERFLGVFPNFAHLSPSGQP